MEIVNTDKAPAAIGPYAQAVVAGGLVYCSGQVAINPKTGALIEDDIAAQTQQALTNLEAVLVAAGSGIDRTLKVTIYLVSMDDFAAVNGVYAEFMAAHTPARATVAVAALPLGARVEIDAIASI